MTAGDRMIRWAAAAATAVVAAIAAVISYGHAYELAVAYGESGATARALPLTVDGLIVTCSLVLLDAARRGERAPVLAWMLLGCGIAATVGANIAHGLDHGLVGAIIAGWPALVAVGSFEMLARLIRGHRGFARDRLSLANGATPSGGVANDGEVPHSGEALSWWPLPALEAPAVVHNPVDGYALWDEIEPVPAAPDGVPEAVLAQARAEFADEVARGRVPALRPIKKRLKVGQPRARQVQAYLAVLAERGPHPVP